MRAMSQSRVRSKRQIRTNILKMKKIISLEVIPRSLTLYPPSFPPTFSLPTFTGSQVTIQAVALNGWIWTFLATISGTEKTHCNIIGLVWYMRYWSSGRKHSEAYGSYAINPSFSMITVTQFCLVKSLFRYRVFVFTRREKIHVFHIYKRLSNSTP